MPYLDVAQLLKFHFVFDDFKISRAYDDVFEAIRGEILENFRAIMPKFYFASPDEEAIKTALIKLARSDRKRFCVNKILPRNLTNRIYAQLFGKDFLTLEKSREKAPLRAKNERAKRSERRYKIEDKIHFNSNFSRFWFRFIEPNLHALKQGKTDAVMDEIRAEFDEYASLAYELVCKELAAKIWRVDEDKISSFWHRNIEIDMLFEARGEIVAGEAKYRKKKTCKNVLNLLLRKCEILGIKPAYIALFSKSGFSNELQNLKDNRVLLFETKEFERLLR